LDPTPHASDATLTDQIRAGLAAGEFEPFFQPIVDLGDRRIVGFEVLARWNHPVRGLLFPVEFVAQAEDSGQIRAIDASILDTAWRSLRATLAAQPALPKPLLLSVNLSTQHFLDDEVVGRLRALCLEGLSQTFDLQLEITETQLIHDKDEAEKILHELKQLGISIALDDFGTGYSSLVYVHRLPIDCIKIDRSFSEGILESERSRAIVAAIINLARSLGIRTVAEGVEDSQVAQALLALGCQFGQGMLFGPPTAADKISALIRRMVNPPAGP
jgi:EAL domain-containing protein (putative c-di-GMP-specific phosphodiesterase class I)